MSRDSAVFGLVQVTSGGPALRYRPPQPLGASVVVVASVWGVPPAPGIALSGRCTSREAHLFARREERAASGLRGTDEGKGTDGGRERPPLSAKRERRERHKKALARLRYSRETVCDLLRLSRLQAVYPPTPINAVVRQGYGRGVKVFPPYSESGYPAPPAGFAACGTSAVCASHPTGNIPPLSFCKSMSIF